MLTVHSDSPICDEGGAVGDRDDLGEGVHRRGSLARAIVAMAPVEHRQVDGLRVDQFGAVAARGEGFDDPARELDALPVAAIASIEDEDGAAHASLGGTTLAKTEALAPPDRHPKLPATKIGRASCRERGCQYG